MFMFMGLVTWVMSETAEAVSSIDRLNMVLCLLACWRSCP